MSQHERVAIACDSCSPEDATVHEVLSSGGGLLTLRCTACGHVRKEAPPDETTVERKVVVSQGGESLTTTVEAPPADTVRVGEEFVVDTDEALLAVRITDLETAPEHRVEEATVEEISTFWTRAVDNVRVNVTLHPKDGGADETRSLDMGVPGDHEFTVGETEEHGDERFEVTGLVIRDDAAGYPDRTLDRRRDSALAKDVKRVYAVDQTTDAWSAW